MADVQWIKIATQIFDNRKIKQIEKMPEGDAIIVVWFKLLCLAGTSNKNGMIFFTDEIPYTEEMLATEFGMEQQQRFNVLRLALNTFERFKMIEIIDNIFYISSWEKYQNIDRCLASSGEWGGAHL
jgi:predicted phage replisome organizer